MRKPKRRKLVEEVERLRDPRRILEEYDSFGVQSLAPASEEIPSAEFDSELGEYFEQFLDDLQALPRMPKIDLKSQESAVEALRMLEERLAALEQNQRTASALQRLLTGKLTEQ